MPKRTKSKSRRRSLKYKIYIPKQAGEQDEFARGRQQRQQQRQRDDQQMQRIMDLLRDSAQPGRGPPGLSPRRGAVSPGSSRRSQTISSLLLSSPRRSRSPGRAASPAVAGPRGRSPRRRSRSPRRAASPAVAGPRRRSRSPGRAASPAVAGPRGRAASPAVAGRRSVCQSLGCALQFRSKRSKRRSRK